MKDQKAAGPSKRELELELELWGTRKQSIQNASAALQSQAQLLPLQLKDVDANIARCQAALSAFTSPDESGGGPGEEKP